MKEIKFREVKIDEKFYDAVIGSYLMKVAEYKEFFGATVNAEECDIFSEGWYFHDDDIVFLAE